MMNRFASGVFIIMFTFSALGQNKIISVPNINAKQSLDFLFYLKENESFKNSALYILDGYSWYFVDDSISYNSFELCPNTVVELNHFQNSDSLKFISNNSMFLLYEFLMEQHEDYLKELNDYSNSKYKISLHKVLLEGKNDTFQTNALLDIIFDKIKFPEGLANSIRSNNRLSYDELKTFSDLLNRPITIITDQWSGQKINSEWVVFCLVAKKIYKFNSNKVYKINRIKGTKDSKIIGLKTLPRKVNLNISGFYLLTNGFKNVMWYGVQNSTHCRM